MFIYGLFCPIRKKILYVGKAVNPERRLREHLSPCQLQLPYRKNGWLIPLLEQGLSPEMRILEEVSDGSTWQEREQYWIKKYGRENLLNETDGGDGRDGYKKDFMSFEEARDFVQGLGLPSFGKGWVPYCTSGKKPDDIPSNPQKVYTDRWVSWNDWLRGEEKVEYLPFEEARSIVQELGLSSQTEWSKWSASKKRPKNIPSHPEATYKDQGWIGYGDWLRGEAPKEFLSFEDAREVVRKLRLKDQLEWKKYVTSGKKPDNIPSAPWQFYNGSGWKNMADWLGYRPKKGFDFLSFKEARKKAHALKLQTSQEWMDWAQSDKRPTNIPSSPNVKYQEEWLSWADWLGTNPGHQAHTRKSKNFIEFEEARSTIRQYDIQGYDKWRQFCRDKRLPKGIPSNPQIYYKHSGWLNWPDWLEKEKAP